MTPDRIPAVETIDTVIGARLRAIREGKRMSRPEVAREAGLNHKTIERIEAGQRSANAQQLDAITRVYGLSVHVFMRDALQGTPFGARSKDQPDSTPAT